MATLPWGLGSAAPSLLTWPKCCGSAEVVAAFLRICGKTAAEEGRETLTARCWRERELRKSSCCSTDAGVQPRGAW